MVFIGKYAIAIIRIAVVLIAAIFKGAVAEISIKLKHILKLNYFYHFRNSYFMLLKNVGSPIDLNKNGHCAH